MTAGHINALRRYRTPIVYDAIERFGIRPKAEGYTDATIRTFTPGLGPFAGYAVTGKIVAAAEPQPDETTVPWRAVWDAIARTPGPKLMICEDLDHPPRGCAWGDVSASIFQRLGCSAVITNGAVRDVRQAEALGFGMFASSLIVGHANVRFVAVNEPVTVGGLSVRPGDLLHADEHGVVVIPAEIDLVALLDMIDRLLRSEAAIIDYARNGADFSVERLNEQMDRLNAAGGHHLR